MNDALTESKLIVAEKTIHSLRESLAFARFIAAAACVVLLVGVGFYLANTPKNRKD